MRRIYLLTSIAALGASATQCGTPAADPPYRPTSGGAATSGGEATATTGGAMNGGAMNGGATVTSGGAITTSGGSVSGGATGSSGGTPTSGGAGGTSGSAGMAGGGAGGGSSGEAGKAGGGAAGGAGAPTSGGAAGSAGASGSAGNATGGAAGSAGAGGTGGAAVASFADVAKILNANCGMFCHKAGNDKGHIVLSNADGMLYTRLTTALASTQACPGAILANTADASKSLLPLIVQQSVSTMGCNNVPRMPNMCSTTSGSPGGNPPSCLSKADIDTIQAWVNQGAKGP